MLESLQTFFAQGIGAVIKALLLLVLAIVISKIAQVLIEKLLGFSKVRDALAKIDPETNGGNIVSFIGKLVHLLVFLLFVPGIFSALGAQSISEPILNVLNSIWGYVPNILAAAIVLVVGLFIARMVRQLLIPLFKKLNVDAIQEKAGIQVVGSAKLSYTLAYIVYVLILIPVIIVALQVLGIRAISDPAVNTLQAVFNFIPNVIVAALIIILGVVIAGIAGQIVKNLLAASGIDGKIGKFTDERLGGLRFSSTVGTITKVVIIIFFVVQGISVLHLTVLSEIGATIIAYMPKLLASVIIAFICVFASSMAEKALRKAGLKTYGFVAKVVIYVFGVFMILNQLDIASRIVSSAFIIILAAIAVAFALAFGFGGKDFAMNVLNKLQARLNEVKKDDK